MSSIPIYRVEVAICWDDGKWTAYWLTLTKDSFIQDGSDERTEGEIWEAACDEIEISPDFRPLKAIGLISYTRLDPQELLS